MALSLPRGWHAITPRIVVDDVAGMVEFLRDVFGAIGDVVPDRPAVLSIADSRIMVSGAGPRPVTPAFLHLYVEDVDATYHRAVLRGARSLEAPVDMAYGDRRVMIEDSWGNVWQIAAAQRGAPSPFALHPLGVVRSPLSDRASAPKQGREGAPDAWLELEPDLRDALDGVRPGDDLVVITWLHCADRDTLKVHPRGDPDRLCGVFATRSPDRPNPLGLHRVTVRAIDGTRLRVGPIEAIDGTPIVDIKTVLSHTDDA